MIIYEFFQIKHLRKWRSDVIERNVEFSILTGGTKGSIGGLNAANEGKDSLSQETLYTIIVFDNGMSQTFIKGLDVEKVDNQGLGIVVLHGSNLVLVNVNLCTSGIVAG